MSAVTIENTIENLLALKSNDFKKVVTVFLTKSNPDLLADILAEHSKIDAGAGKPKRKAGRPKKVAPTPLTDDHIQQMVDAGTKPNAQVRTLAELLTSFGIPDDLHKAARTQWVA